MYDKEPLASSPETSRSVNIIQQMVDNMIKQSDQKHSCASELSLEASGPVQDMESSAETSKDHLWKCTIEQEKNRHQCPHCGYCHTCGRGPYTFPNYPIYPTYPTYPVIQPWISYCGNQSY
jgi:hypothetical protein